MSATRTFGDGLAELYDEVCSDIAVVNEKAPAVKKLFESILDEPLPLLNPAVVGRWLITIAFQTPPDELALGVIMFRRINADALESLGHLAVIQ